MQILSGLQEGEQVVTSGGLGLEDKAKVAIQRPRAKTTKMTTTATSEQDKAKDEPRAMTNKTNERSNRTRRSDRSRSIGPRGFRGPSSSSIITLIVVGVYLAFTIPVAVFPVDRFPAHRRRHR